MRSRPVIVDLGCVVTPKNSNARNNADGTLNIAQELLQSALWYRLRASFVNAETEVLRFEAIFSNDAKIVVSHLSDPENRVWTYLCGAIWETVLLGNGLDSGKEIVS
jgi:hypothetical protein